MRVVWSIRETVPEDMDKVRALFKEYEKWLGVDLCFQGFQAELASLPSPYARPRGAIFVALLQGEFVGCVAIKPLDKRTCEMKRLFVREKARGRGIGRALARRAMREGQKLGYTKMRLDSLERMDKAIELYEGLGFRRIEPYYENPMADSVFMERKLA